MTGCWTSAVRALVAATLLLATATLMLVAVNTARAAGAPAVGICGAYGQTCGFSTSGVQQNRARQLEGKPAAWCAQPGLGT